MDITDKILAATFAATIAGAISLLIYVLDRSKEITKARKEWIDGVRADISIFLGATTTISRLWDEKPTGQTLGQFRQKNKVLYENANTAFHKALLHLNRQENEDAEEEKLRSDLKSLHDGFFGPDADCSSVSLSLAEPVRQSARRLFQREWAKVKQGEPIYRFVKAVSLGLVFGVVPPLALLWVIWLGYLPVLGTVVLCYLVYAIAIGSACWMIGNSDF